MFGKFWCILTSPFLAEAKRSTVKFGHMSSRPPDALTGHGTPAKASYKIWLVLQFGKLEHVDWTRRQKPMPNSTILRATGNTPIFPIIVVHQDILICITLNLFQSQFFIKFTASTRAFVPCCWWHGRTKVQFVTTVTPSAVRRTNQYSDLSVKTNKQHLLQNHNLIQISL